MFCFKMGTKDVPSKWLWFREQYIMVTIKKATLIKEEKYPIYSGHHVRLLIYLLDIQIQLFHFNFFPPK